MAMVFGRSWRKIMFRTLFISILFWLFHPWRPSLVFDRTAFGSAAGYGLPLLGTSSLNYWVRNADKLLIGRYLGEAEIGILQQAVHSNAVPTGQYYPGSCQGHVPVTGHDSGQ